MTVLNSFLKVCCVSAICFSVAQAKDTANSKSEVTSSNVSKLEGLVKGEKTKKGMRDRLCKKANLFSAKISFRSLNGNLCVGPLGALALLTCKGYSDKDGPFEDSACYKKAVEGVGRGDPEANAVSLVVNSLKDTASVVKPLVCMVGPIALDVTGVGAPLGVALGGACGVSNAIGSH